MRAVSVAAGVVLTMAVATGCGGSGDSSEAEGKGQKSDGRPLAKLGVPSAYDRARGWDETLSWVPDAVSSVPVTTTRSGKVAMLHAASNGYTVRVRDADGGGVRWTSKPWNPPAEVEGAQGDPEHGEAAEIPGVSSVSQGGREYVVTYAHGMRGKSDLRKGTEVVRMSVYPADASGSSVKPVRQIDVPVTADPGQLALHAEGGRLLLGWGEDGMYPKWTAEVNVVAGKVKRYEDAGRLLPQCEKSDLCDGGRVMATGREGPLVELEDGGFGVPGQWFSTEVRPSGVKEKTGILNAWNGAVYGVGAGKLLAEWKTGGTYADDSSSWSVHDIGSGARRAQMTCEYDEDHSSVTADKSRRDHPVVTSPNGRYLAAGPVAFDLKRKRGICLQGDGDRKTIAVATIQNDGTAYGAVGTTRATPPTRTRTRTPATRSSPNSTSRPPPVSPRRSARTSPFR